MFKYIFVGEIFFSDFFFPALPDPESVDATNAPFTLIATHINAQRIQPN